MKLVKVVGMMRVRESVQELMELQGGNGSRLIGIRMMVLTKEFKEIYIRYNLQVLELGLLLEGQKLIQVMHTLMYILLVGKTTGRHLALQHLIVLILL